MKMSVFGDKRGMDIIYNAHEQTAYGAAQAKAEDKARAAEFAALSNPLVLAARAFEKDGKTVLAVLTEPIYLASDRTKLKELLTAEASAAAGSPVTLTFDLDVYRRISPDMSDEVKAFILKKLGA